LNAPLRWYLTSTAALLLPAGIQSVLFPYLIAVVLHEPADRLGIAQMTGALPGLFLILLGGVMGDRFDQRRILVVLHLCGALPPLVLALLLATGHLDYALMLSYALIWGLVGAFSQPARDALLSRVAGDRIQRTVTMMMALQFAVQIVGINLGGLADRIGAVPLILTQASIMALGALAVMRIRVERFVAPAEKQHALREVAAALRLVWDSQRMLPVMVLAFAVGVFFAGTYVVLIPLTVRDVYHGGASGIAFAFMLNMIGTIAATLLLLARGGLTRPGRAVVLALAIGSAVLLPLYWGVSIEVFYLIIFAWGAGGGIVMSMSRTIVQEAAPPAFRARVMSVYSLGMMGGMPIGSVATGYIVNAVGAQNAALVPVIGMAIVVAAVAARSDLWRLLPHHLEARV
jgi:MFS family permease